MLTAGDVLLGDLGDVIADDPDVRQARMIAAAAKTRLLACVAGSDGETDLAEAQRMLDAVRAARALAEEAEDRVLVHRGLLTPAEAGRREARRRPGPGDPAVPAGAARPAAAAPRTAWPRGAWTRGGWPRGAWPRGAWPAYLLACGAACFAAVALARRLGVLRW